MLLEICEETTATSLASQGPPQGQGFHQICQDLSEESNTWLLERDDLQEEHKKTRWLTFRLVRNLLMEVIIDACHAAPSSKANKRKRKSDRCPQLEQQPRDHQEPQ